ncbi:MAG: Ig-like domain-containing protein, partial [Paracoccaceae bacterium]
DISPTHDRNNPIALYGFDVGTLAIYPPSWKDVMTYCNNLWMSDVTYEGIRSRMVSESGLAAAHVAATDLAEHLVVFGAVISPTDEIHLETFYRMPEGADAFGRVPGEYSIRLLDAAGATLADYAFTPNFEHLDAVDAFLASAAASTEMVGTIAEAVPWVDGTARVAIFHGTVELASRAVTAHAPQVTLTSPNGGESFTGDTIPVTWQASDADGDALVYSLGYSTDGGTTWHLVASDFTGTQLSLDAKLIRGSTQGKFRLVASDGVNTGQDETDGVFSVPNKAPDVRVTSPGAAAAYDYGQSVGLVADARDVEDGTLFGASLTWTSNLSGTVGSGAMLHVTDLITGVHTLTVTATDTDGAKGTDVVVVFIGVQPKRIYLPITSKLH